MELIEISNANIWISVTIWMKKIVVTNKQPKFRDNCNTYLVN